MRLWERNLCSLWFGQFIAMVALTMVTPFLPLYVRELGVSGEEAVKLWSGVIYAAPFVRRALTLPSRPKAAIHVNPSAGRTMGQSIAQPAKIFSSCIPRIASAFRADRISRGAGHPTRIYNLGETFFPVLP
jgi:MFS family permease